MSYPLITRYIYFASCVYLLSMSAQADASDVNLNTLSKILSTDTKLNEPIEQCFDLNYFPAYQKTIVSWNANTVGIEAPAVIKSSYDPIVDLACLEAVCANLPETDRLLTKGTRRACQFGAAQLKNEKSAKTLIYERDNNLDGKAFLVYRIPLSMHMFTPKAFTAKELQSEANTRILVRRHDETAAQISEIAQQKMIAYLAEWSKFRYSNRKPSREAILTFATNIERKFGLEKASKF